MGICGVYFFVFFKWLIYRFTCLNLPVVLVNISCFCCACTVFVLTFLLGRLTRQWPIICALEFTAPNLLSLAKMGPSTHLRISLCIAKKNSTRVHSFKKKKKNRSSRMDEFHYHEFNFAFPYFVQFTSYRQETKY